MANHYTFGIGQPHTEVDEDLPPLVFPAPNTFCPQQFKSSAGETDFSEDDTEAVQWAMNQAIASRGAVWLGSGKYRITSPMGTLITVPISIIGAGASCCEIKVDPSMVGDALSFSNTWYGADVIYVEGDQTGQDWNGTKWVTRNSGVTLAGFTIIGDRTTTNTQNGIIFYDRNDAVRLRDVEVHFIKGIGICLSGLPSVPATNTATLIRESDIDTCQVRWCGDKATARPALMMNCSGRTVITSDDANNYNYVRNMKAVFSDGLAFQNNTYNLHANQASNNDIDIIIDSSDNLSSCDVSSGYSSITNGVLTVAAGATITGTLEVGQYLNNSVIPPGTYISAVLTGSGGIGTYQLAHKIFDLSTFSEVAGNIFTLRANIQYMQACGGHVGDRWKVTINGSHMLGSGAVGIEFNQNCLSGTTPKTIQSELSYSCGSLDVGLMFTTINSLSITWRIRGPTTSITALNITGSVSVDILGELSSGRLAIGGVVDKLFVRTGAQLVVDALPPAAKYPNAFFLLNTAGVYTRHVSDGTSWIAA